MAAAHCALGTLYRDLFALPQAFQHFEQTLQLANETCSLHWIHTSIGYLASTYVEAREPLKAENILKAALAPTTPDQMLGQRLMWCARAELALAMNKPSQALEIITQLQTSSTPKGDNATILRLSKLRGEALIALNQTDEAEIVLQHACNIAQQMGALSLLWRIEATLAKCYHAQRRYEAAENCVLVARTTIETLAQDVPGEALRTGFLQHTHDLLSFHSQTSSTRRATKRAYDGLTEREREIAVRIARGQSTSDIADALVISERTVETHIGNIFSKLGFNARTQIATWASEKGLLKEDR
jgi:DNA-binding CsgD family transcriptional regulator